MARKEWKPLSTKTNARVEQDALLVKAVIKAAVGADISRERRRMDDLDDVIFGEEGRRL